MTRLHIQLRWDGEQGLAAHGNVSKVMTRPLTIGGIEFAEIDFQVRPDQRTGIEHTYAWVKEPGAPMGRYATDEEAAEMVRRLQDMAAAASYALRRRHSFPVRVREWLAGISAAFLRFPAAPRG